MAVKLEQYYLQWNTPHFDVERRFSSGNKLYTPKPMRRKNVITNIKIVVVSVRKKSHFFSCSYPAPAPIMLQS